MSVSRKADVRPELPPVEEIKYSPQIKRWIVIILAVVAVLFLLHVAEVLPPFIWALVTAFIFNAPLKALTDRFSMPRWFWAMVIYLLFFGLLALTLLLVVPALTREAKTLSNDAPHIQQTVNDYLDANPSVNIVGIEVSSDTARNTLDNVLSRIPQIAQDLGPRLLSGTFRFLIDFLLYLITTFYLMLIGGRVVWRFIDTLPLKYRGEMRSLASRINVVLGAYIKGQFLLVLIMSVASFIVLTILGVRYNLLLAIMVGVLELIPFVGPYLAIGICCLVAYFQPQGPNHSFGMDGITLAIVVAVALFILRQAEDYLVIPNVIGRIVELPPLIVIFSTISGAALLGPMGLLLSVPIVAMLKIVIGYLYYKMVDAERTKLLIPAGTSFEEFYALLENYEPDSRLLIITEEDEDYLRNPADLARLKELSQQKYLDLAFYCTEEEEKTQAVLREAHFPVITMDQEHFLGNYKH